MAVVVRPSWGWQPLGATFGKGAFGYVGNKDQWISIHIYFWQLWWTSPNRLCGRFCAGWRFRVAQSFLGRSIQKSHHRWGWRHRTFSWKTPCNCQMWRSGEVCFWHEVVCQGHDTGVCTVDWNAQLQESPYPFSVQGSREAWRRRTYRTTFKLGQFHFNEVDVDLAPCATGFVESNYLVGDQDTCMDSFMWWTHSQGYVIPSSDSGLSFNWMDSWP